MKSFQKTCEACAPWGMTVLRIVLGLIMIMHGYPKLFGDTSASLAFFESTVLPLPGPLMILSGVLEFFGGILLVFGLKTRTVSALLVLQFLVILLFVKLQLGFFQLEFDLLILSVAFALSSQGAGKLSLERLLTKKGRKDHAGHGGEAMGG